MMLKMAGETQANSHIGQSSAPQDIERQNRIQQNLLNLLNNTFEVPEDEPKVAPVECSKPEQI